MFNIRDAWEHDEKNLPATFSGGISKRAPRPANVMLLYSLKKILLHIIANSMDKLREYLVIYVISGYHKLEELEGFRDFFCRYFTPTLLFYQTDLEAASRLCSTTAWSRMVEPSDMVAF